MPTKGYIDGTMAYGSSVLVIDGVSYIANNIKVTRPPTDAQQNDTQGSPGARRSTLGVCELTAELQLATGATRYGGHGKTFVYSPDVTNYGVETWICDPPPHNEDNAPGSIRVYNLTAKKRITNTVTTF